MWINDQFLGGLELISGRTESATLQIHQALDDFLTSYPLGGSSHEMASNPSKFTIRFSFSDIQMDNDML